MHAAMDSSGAPWHWRLGISYPRICSGGSAEPSRSSRKESVEWCHDCMSFFSVGRIQQYYMQVSKSSIYCTWQVFFLVLSRGVQLKCCPISPDFWGAKFAGGRPHWPMFRLKIAWSRYNGLPRLHSQGLTSGLFPPLHVRIYTLSCLNARASI